MPAGLNNGWSYRDRIAPGDAGRSLCAYFAGRYRHSSQALWQARLAAGEIRWNGQLLLVDRRLATGDRLEWDRPPWEEPPVPEHWCTVFDDGDLHVINKPSGLPVVPAGGYLEHTLQRMLERRWVERGGGVPRPVHRLGRFTSGLLVCARQQATRAWLSARLRQTTASPASGPGDGGQPCRKIYRALTVPAALPLEPGEWLEVSTAIGRRPHPLLGEVWCAASADSPGALAARSVVRLLERRADGDRVEVTIHSGRPHQIRIHLASLGAPLLGDPLYLPGGGARVEGLPGEGGYHLHAHRLLIRSEGQGHDLDLTAPLPKSLTVAKDG
ncbi:RluA family pseudouridine synthase [Synechococcus sp. CS-1324]|nr:RluA family pseudouridine synthase [Synechococcus sp. CS-1324]